jgi:hypothetical protein
VPTPKSEHPGGLGTENGSGVSGVIHLHGFLLVVVLIVDENRILALETERDPPIAVDLDRKVTGEIAF